MQEATSAAAADANSGRILAGKRPARSIEVKLLEGAGQLLGSDFNVRDLVSVRSGTFGVSVEKLIVDATLKIDGRGGSVELVTDNPPRSAMAEAKTFHGYRGGAGLGSQFKSANG
jgi:hypothetical protein